MTTALALTLLCACERQTSAGPGDDLSEAEQTAGQDRSLAAATVRFMVVGDSISQGHEGDFTWRYRLWKHLSDAGLTAQFVGPWTGTARLGPWTGISAPPRHDGAYRQGISFPQPANLAEWGWMMAEGKARIANEMTTYRPDVLLIELGFNDIAWNLSDTPPADVAISVLGSLRDLVRNARSVDPSIKVLVADAPQRTPIENYPALPWKIAAYNERIDGVLAALNREAPGSPVHRVYFDLLYDENTDTYDGLHPNVRGEYVIAKAFADELAKKFGIGSTMNLPSSMPADLRPPAVPRVTAQVHADFTATLAWDHIFAAGGFWIWTRNLSRGEADFQQLMFPIGADGWKPSMLPAGHTIEYKVQTMRGDYRAALSPSARIVAPALQEARITSVRPGPDLYTVALSWTAVPNADDYHVYASTDCSDPVPSTSSGYAMVQYGLGTKTSWTQSFVTVPCVNYYVVASKNGGEGPRPPLGVRTAPLMGHTFFTHNICGSDSKCDSGFDPVDTVLNEVQLSHPIAFALQEVCAGQANEIAARLRAAGLSYVQRFRNAAWAGFDINCSGLDRAWGNVVFHAGNVLGEVREGDYRQWREDSLRGYVCVKVPANARQNQPRPFWACSTHIDFDQNYQASQIVELAEVTEGLRGADSIPVVIGGDFNAKPPATSLNPMFSRAYINGSGTFIDRTVSADRKQPADKIDFIFSAGMATDTGREYDALTSDHPIVARVIGF